MILQQHPISARKGEGIQGREKVSNLHMCVQSVGDISSFSFHRTTDTVKLEKTLECSGQAQVLRFLKLMHTVTEDR